MLQDKKKIRAAVKQSYGRIAEQGGSCCASCGCGGSAADRSLELGYSEKEIAGAPAGAVLGLGCGNPSGLADLRAGETVLDLGSGPGLDAFLAAAKVGGKGKVIGVDMTPQMIDRARENARQGGRQNVEFKLGEIENLPVADRSVDVIISNCVINLSPDKAKVFREAFRVLKAGGRLFVSDLVIKGRLTQAVRRSLDAWAGCVAGATGKERYLDLIAQAGFKRIEILSESEFNDPGAGKELQGMIVSLEIKAVKGQNDRKRKAADG